MSDQPAAGEPQVIDSGPVVLQATTDPYERDEEDGDGGDRPGAGK